MDENMQILLVVALPSLITGVLSYFIAWKSANNQIKAIREQNKADIELLMLKYENELKKDRERIYNECITRVLDESLRHFLDYVFSENCPATEQINKVIENIIIELNDKKDEI